MSKVISITKEEFQKEVIEMELPVLVQFCTDECGPCEAMEPTLEEFAETSFGKVKVVKHNVTYEDVMEKLSDVAIKYEIMSFPTMCIFKDGEEVKRFIGGLYDDQLLEFVKGEVTGL
ncbi:thioredoxin family protein [Psychrobacillus sp. L4]|uniref:thioredoxin family protein n=1 Tax=Psychrobacillus sp. L4 TaxID=3236892 RepID=UPI0036F299D1